MKNPITFDVVIIGAGVIGCAMARRFSLQGASVLVLEKAVDILDGASKANSAILHTGFDAPQNSIELSCIRQGHKEYIEISKQHNFTIDKAGALVVAWNNQELSRLEDILKHAHNNGVISVTRISKNQLQQLEPNLSSTLLSAIHVPQEYLIDPWTTPYSYLYEAMSLGAKIKRGQRILKADFDGNDWQIKTQEQTWQSRVVINCAGLYGDQVDQLFINKTAFTIKPRKGQFVVFDKAAYPLVNSIILPVPSQTTKGVVVCRTVFGNVLVGPTAEEQDSREDDGVDKINLQMLLDKAYQVVPDLKNIPITATYAGIRPATEYKDYCIKPYKDNQYISVSGIRSTGLSAALGVAKYVYNLYQDQGYSHKPSKPSNYVPPKGIAEKSRRNWQHANNLGIVCHCEKVTRQEIEEVFNEPVPPNSLAALKRRTRVTMGRCQGFYCAAQLAKMTEGKFVYDFAHNIVNSNSQIDESKTNDSKLNSSQIINTKMNSESIDVAIIGAGPSGLSLATELKKLGVKNVVVFERESYSGGVPRHCGHSPFGMREFKRVYSGKHYAEKLTEVAKDAGVLITLNTTVIKISNNQLTLSSSEFGEFNLSAKKIVIATGTREQPRSARLVSGTRGKGIVTTGGLQSLVYLQSKFPCKKAVIIGTELIAFSSILSLKHAKSNILAMVEANQRISAPWFCQLLAKLYNIPIYFNSVIETIHASHEVQSVIIQNQKTKERVKISCDGVIFTGQFVAESHLLSESNLGVDDQQLPIINQYGQCSDKNIYCVGNISHPVETAGWCWQQGKNLAKSISLDIYKDHITENESFSIRMKIDHHIEYITPQKILYPLDDLSFNRFWQLRFKSFDNRHHQKPKGVLYVLFDNKVIWKKRIIAKAHRRVTIPMKILKPLSMDKIKQFGYLQVSFELE